MQRTNLFSPEFDHTSERDGFRWRGPRDGRAVGDSDKVGVWSGDGEVAMLVPRSAAAVDCWEGEA